MTRIQKELDAAYLSALQDYLSGSGEEALQRVYELGRAALNHGVGLLELSAVHNDALLTVWEQRFGSDHQSLTLLERGEIFLAEALSPFEMSHRGVQEANVTLRRLNQTLEDEAKRIAHALHDESGQLLASVHIALDAIACDSADPVPSRIQEVRGLLKQVEVHLRQVSHELRPPVLDDLGLVPALEFLVQSVSKRSGLAITLEGSFEERLPVEIETVLYRVFQESLTNVVRHAGPANVRIRLHREASEVGCVVVDDGVGFDPATVLRGGKGGGLGLRGMRERLSAVGGRLELESAPSRGTRVSVTIPLEV